MRKTAFFITEEQLYCSKSVINGKDELDIA